MRKRLLTPLIALLALLLSASTALASNGRILVYVGNAALDEGYTKFGAAAGKPVDTLPVLPADLSPYDCIVLPINNIPFDASQKTQLSDYVYGGGTLLALAEHLGFPGSITTMNDLAASLGAGLEVIPAAHDGGFNTTDNIDASTLTVGVETIRYAATSEVQVLVSGDAESLVRTQDSSGAITFIGADRLGSGVFLLSGDSNVFSDPNDTGYTVEDNGVFVANLCGGPQGPGAPAEIVLTQDSAVNDVGTQHCVTATVLDANGQPVPGVEVSFNVEGASDEPLPPNDAEGTITTDRNGMAKFCYTGPAFPGADKIFAFIDENDNGSWDPDELKSNDLAKTWVLPAPTPGCEVTISNGGWIITEGRDGHRASFGGHALVSNGSEPDVTGNQEYQDKAEPLNYHSNNVITVVCSRDRTEATMYAEGTVNGAGSFLARIGVRDGGEGSGATDTYDILINNGYYSGEDRPLQGGNVQIQVHED